MLRKFIMKKDKDEWEMNPEPERLERTLKRLQDERIEKIVRQSSKHLKIAVDALVADGFSREEAIDIVKNSGIDIGGVFDWE